MSDLGDELLKSLSEVLAYERGARVGYRVHHVKVVPNDVRNARARLGLSQDLFARAFGVSPSTLRKWEQGQRQPAGAAKTLLRVIENEPEAVLRALASR